MGRDKCSIAVSPGGPTFLQHAIERLAACCDMVVVSQAHNAVVRHDDGPIAYVRDDEADRGPVGGLVAALRHARRLSRPAVLVTPVDVPDLTVADCQHLWRAHHEHKTQIILATSTADDRWQPLVAVYPVDLIESLTRLADSDDRSLMRFLQREPSRSRVHPVIVPAAHLRNVNRPS